MIAKNFYAANCRNRINVLGHKASQFGILTLGGIDDDVLSRSITRHVQEEDDLCESRAATLPGRIFRKRRHSRLASPAPQPSVCVDLPSDQVRREWSPQRVGPA